MTVTDLGLTDASVPGVAVIADAAALSRLVAGTGEDLVDRAYLRYKPGTSLVAALRLRSGPAFAYAVSGAARPKLAKVVERAPTGSLLHWSLTDGLLLARPAADRHLPALADGLARLSGDPEHGSGPPAWTTLAYKPQRRWVGRLADADDEQEPVLRAYRRSALREALRGWRLGERVAADQPQLRVPRVATRSDRLGALAVDWLPGQPLDRVLEDHRGSPALLAEVGAALATVHASLPGEDPGQPADQHRADRLRAAADVVEELGTVLPGCRGRAAAVLRTLQATRPRGGAIRPVHGDFSADQVIVEAGCSVSIGHWDRAGWGDPAVDLGSLRAAGLTDEAYDAVLKGYRSVRELPPAISWHTVLAGLLRLTEPLRSCRKDWRSKMDARLTALEDDSAALRDERRECA